MQLAENASAEKIFVCIPRGAIVQVTLLTKIANIDGTNFIPSFSWVNPGFLSNTSNLSPSDATCDRHARSNVNAKVEFVRLIQLENKGVLEVQGAMVKVPDVNISMTALFVVNGMKQTPLVRIKSTKPPNTPPKSVGAGPARGGGSSSSSSSSAAAPVPEFPNFPNERRRRGCRRITSRKQRKQRTQRKQRNTRKTRKTRKTQRR